MGFSEEDKIIIKYIRKKYGHGRKKIMEDHPEKSEWTAGGLDHLLCNIGETGMLAEKKAVVGLIL